jgi:mRNA interferase MazF
MKKFEIWTVAGGEHTSKPRPCMIMQSDVISSFETVIIAPITTFNAGDSIYRIPLQVTIGTGLTEKSFIEVEKISAVKKRFLGKRIGEVPNEAFNNIDESTAKLLGIKAPRK